MVLDFDGYASYHDIRIMQASVNEQYEEFLLWPPFQQWLIHTNNESICKNSFYNAFCPCCIEGKQRDCAKFQEVGLRHLLHGLYKLRKQNEELVRQCSCANHKKSAYQSMHVRLPTRKGGSE